MTFEQTMNIQYLILLTCYSLSYRSFPYQEKKQRILHPLFLVEILLFLKGKLNQWKPYAQWQALLFQQYQKEQ